MAYGNTTGQLKTELKKRLVKQTSPRRVKRGRQYFGIAAPFQQAPIRHTDHERSGETHVCFPSNRQSHSRRPASDGVIRKAAPLATCGRCICLPLRIVRSRISDSRDQPRQPDRSIQKVLDYHPTRRLIGSYQLLDEIKQRASSLDGDEPREGRSRITVKPVADEKWTNTLSRLTLSIQIDQGNSCTT